MPKKKEHTLVKVMSPILLRQIGVERGIKDRKEGKSRDQNPWIEGSDLHNHWNDGYDYKD